MMPLLIALIMWRFYFYVLHAPALWKGVKYYSPPSFSKFSAATVLWQLGTVCFYSMSLAMGIMITYGSYMKKDCNLEKSARQIEIFDTAIAFLAGLMIIPSVFVFSGGDEAALGKGPSLMFVTLPKVFDDMTLGGVIGTVFFLLVLFAALTSSISLLETNVSIIRDKLGWSRKSHSLRYYLCTGIRSYCFLRIWTSELHQDYWSWSSGFLRLPEQQRINANCCNLTCICIGHFIGSKVVSDEVGFWSI